MTDELTVTITFVKDHYEVVASLTETDALPEAVFLYENTGTDQLGEYIGVCSQAELTSRQVFVGVPIAVFANKYVRYAQAFKAVATEKQAEDVRDHLVKSVKALKAEVVAVQPETLIVEV